MSQGFPGAKICPTCGKTAVIDAQQCSGCGHVYRTKFPPPQPLNQTIGFPGVPLPGAQPPPGINPQNVVNVPMPQPRPQGAWASLSPWAQSGIFVGGICFLILFAAIFISLMNPDKDLPLCDSENLVLPCDLMSDNLMGISPADVNRLFQVSPSYVKSVPNILDKTPPQSDIHLVFYGPFNKGEFLEACFVEDDYQNLLLARLQIGPVEPGVLDTARRVQAPSYRTQPLPPIRADHLDGFQSGPRPGTW